MALRNERQPPGDLEACRKNDVAAKRAHPWLSLAKRTMNRLHEAPCGIELSARRHQLLKQSVSRVHSYCEKGVIMTDASFAACSDGHISWVDWGLKLQRMTHASVGTDLWTVVQNRLHPAVAEAEFTPLDSSYISRIERKG